MPNVRIGNDVLDKVFNAKIFGCYTPNNGDACWINGREIVKSDSL